ncbi:MAG: glycosyltransferase family 1 protein [Bacteroidota bacterium]|nr:glycosyltransferase family 1 protein [Bacteroidota bacterium]
MPEKHLHIVAFDVPYPPNYGGVIDVFYKIKALHKEGVGIILHCFEYPGRDRAEQLNQYCEEVHYYRRKVGLKSALTFKPYIVSSRKSKSMVKRLLEDEYPILFEGLHSCYHIDDKRLKGRFKIYRESNIEHRYYYNLFKVDKKIRSKIYYLFASCKLRYYQRVLKHSSLMLVVSQKDTIYLKKHFKNNKVSYLPSFHANNEVNCLLGKGDYAIYHGNIEVPENAHAAEFLANEVFNDMGIPLVIAGMNPPEHIRKLVEKRSDIRLVANPDDETMFDLIRKAHVNILVTFQATGLKLKLLNTLYKGRFCLVNRKMLNGTMLDELCVIGDNVLALKSQLKRLLQYEFTEVEIDRRKEALKEMYSNEKNAQRLISLVFKRQ